MGVAFWTVLCTALWFVGCAERPALIQSGRSAEADRWLELRTRLHRYDGLAGKDEFLSFKREFVAIAEYLMYCDSSNTTECEGLEFFFAEFDKAVENVRSRRTGETFRFQWLKTRIAETQSKMDRFIETFSKYKDTSKPWEWIGAEKKLMNDLLAALLTDMGMLRLLSTVGAEGGSEWDDNKLILFAERTLVYPVLINEEDGSIVGSFRGLWTFRKMFWVSRRVSAVKPIPVVGTVTKAFLTYYSERILQTDNAPSLRLSDSKFPKFLRTQVRFQDCLVEIALATKHNIYESNAAEIVTSLDLLANRIHKDDVKKLTELEKAAEAVCDAHMALLK
jgi:hypothetical protein